MSCLSIGPVELPQLPEFLLSAPVLTVPFPPTIPEGEVLCCKFELNIPGIDAALALVNATIAAASAAAGAPVIVGVMALNAMMDQVQAQLNDLVLRIPNCPTNGGITT